MIVNIISRDPKAAFWEVIAHAKPGVTENRLNGLMRHKIYELGGEEIQNINVISGNRAYPHPHDASDRMLRMSAWNWGTVSVSPTGPNRSSVGGSASIILKSWKKVWSWPWKPTAARVMMPPGSAGTGLDLRARYLPPFFGSGGTARHPSLMRFL